MRKIFFTLLLAIISNGCYNETVNDIVFAQKLSNVSECRDGCTIVTGDSNVFWYNWRFIPGDVCNTSFGGTPISYVTGSMNRLSSVNPIRVIIWTGQNNYLQSIDKIRIEYDKLFDAIKKLSCPVYIISVHPYYEGRDNVQMILMNDYLKSHDGDGYTFIDIYDDIEKCGEVCFMNSGHLSDAGFKVIQERVLERIE